MTIKRDNYGKFKKLAWNIIASGLPVDYDLETIRKYILINPVILVGIIFLTLLGVLALVQQDYILAAIDFAIMFYLASQFLYLRKTKKIESISLVGVVLIGLFYLFLIAYGGVTQTAYVWAFTYPVIVLFLKGKRVGSYLSFSFLALSCCLFALAFRYDFLSRYGFSLISRFVAAYITIYLIGLVMEFTREKIHRRLEASKLDLESAFDKVQKSTDALGQTNQQLKVEINERKRIEKALRNSESFLDGIIESIQDGICVLDPDLTIRHTNSVMQHWYPNSMPIMGKKCYECFHGRSQPCETCPTIRSLQSGKTERETVSVLPGGSVEYMEVYSFLIKDSETGMITGVVEFLRDITDRKRLEKQLAHAQKMEAVGTLASGVAHDLNNILSGIVSYPELLLMDLPKESPMTKTVRTIQKSGQKAAAIVQDLLTLARRGVPIDKVVNFNDVITSFMDSPECKKIKEFYPKVSFDLNLQTDLMNINGSPVHLSKTVMNLVSNAAEAMGDSGTLCLSTANLHLDSQIDGYEKIPAGEYVILTVSDTGNGISPDDLGRIFEPFYTKKNMGRSGTGLGMAVVWGTLKDHSGFIDIESHPGIGTTFRLYFSVTHRELQKSETASIESYAGNERILVVDDVDVQREIATEMLNRIGYKVATVSSGEAAVEYLKGDSADLVILDMIMDPGMDGLLTYKEIIKINPHQKVIIASGYSETSRVKEAQRLGAGAYLKKPYSMEEIGLAVRAELGR